MNEIELKVIKVEQPIGTMYIGKIKGNELCDLAKADIRKLYNNDDYIGIQRELDPIRVKNIKKYLHTGDASFPNSIILNLRSEYVIEENDTYLRITKNQNAFSIIDGQHRLAGFENNEVSFEVIITIFIDLDDEQQALLFKTINSEQKKVNPSFKYDLEAYSSVKTPEKMIRELTLAFTIDQKSPWYGRIKMSGKKDRLSSKGVISQKAFADPIVKYIYNEEDRYEIRDSLNVYKKENKKEDNFEIKGVFAENKYDQNKYIFWRFYINDKEEILYKILLNYFTALHNVLEDDWEYLYNSVLTKTTGYNAVMKLFKDVYLYLYNEKNFKVESFQKILLPLAKMSGSITAENYGASGDSSANQLYREFLRVLKLK